MMKTAPDGFKKMNLGLKSYLEKQFQVKENL